VTVERPAEDRRPPKTAAPRRRLALVISVAAVAASLLVTAFILAPALFQVEADKGGVEAGAQPKGDDQAGAQPKGDEDQAPPSEIATMTGHEGVPKFLFFLPKTTLILSAENTCIRHFDTEKRKEINHTNKVPGLDGP